MTSEGPLLAVVDDDFDVRIALSRLMASAGFAVESFGSGAAFLKSVDDHEPDCVLLDVHMPDVSGFEIQEALAVGHGSIPIIVITGHDSPESRGRALGLGAKGYLCKPIDDEALLSAIDAAIAGRARSGS